MTCDSFFTIGAAALCALLYGCLVKAGYYAALLPLLASAAYMSRDSENVIHKGRKRDRENVTPLSFVLMKPERREYSRNNRRRPPPSDRVPLR